MVEVSTLDWAITHGVPGVLALVCAAQVYAIRVLYLQNLAVQQARIDDVKQYAEHVQGLTDKLAKTASDLGRTNAARGGFR